MPDFIMPYFKWGEKFAGVYKMIINDEFFYVGSSKNVRQRMWGWRFRISSGKPKNTNIKKMLPVIKTVQFEIIERCTNAYEASRPHQNQNICIG